MATNVTLLLPVLREQLTHVIWRTEREAVELCTRFQNLSRQAEGIAFDENGAGSPEATRLVTALQFQDRTRQQLEHVIEALRGIEAHFKRLSDGEETGALRSERLLLEQFRASLTLPEEHKVFAGVLSGQPTDHASLDPADPGGHITLF